MSSRAKNVVALTVPLFGEARHSIDRERVAL
jgi:hypothetical protein